jgi:hypothetical protein
MILVIVIVSIVVYLAGIAGSKAFFRVYWFFGENVEHCWFDDELSKEGSSYLCAAIWPISFILFGIKKVSELIEKEMEDKTEAPK